MHAPLDQKHYVDSTIMKEFRNEEDREKGCQQESRESNTMPLIFQQTQAQGIVITWGAGRRWYTPLIIALRRQRQAGLCEFKASLVYRVSSGAKAR